MNEMEQKIYAAAYVMFLSKCDNSPTGPSLNEWDMMVAKAAKAYAEKAVRIYRSLEPKVGA